MNETICHATSEVCKSNCSSYGKKCGMKRIRDIKQHNVGDEVRGCKCPTCLAKYKPKTQKVRVILI